MAECCVGGEAQRGLEDVNPKRLLAEMMLDNDGLKDILAKSC